MNEIAVCTISSKNFIAHARTMIKSVAANNTDCDYFFLLADEIENKFNRNEEPFEVVEARELGIDKFEEMAFKYDIVEFNVSLKPFLIKWLLQKGYKKVLYFDADIMVCHRLDVITDLLDHNSIIITPHILSPIPVEDSFNFREAGFLKDGTYNLGFIAVSKTDETETFLNWWSLKCADECYREVETGLFVDQKWIDLVPTLFSGVHILKHPGCNIGYWNFHERKLRGLIVNDNKPVLFFHFSGLDIENIDQISKYQDCYTLTSRTDLKEIFENYKKCVQANGYNEAKDLTYKYGKYDNGVKIGSIARRLFCHVKERFPFPFSTTSNSYFELLKKKNLLESDGADTMSKSQVESKKKVLNKLLKLLSIIIGIDRYSDLMRYMRYTATIRHQKFLIDSEAPRPKGRGIFSAA